MKLSTKAAAVALALGAACTAAWAATPAQTIAARQANFKAIGKAFKALRDEVGKDAPSQAVLSANATILANSAARIPGLFPAGTGQASGVKTAALPTIWTRNGDFRASANQLLTSARAVQGAAAAGNINGVKAGLGRLGGSCKSCHDVFKAKD
jgi:cytochrome c556